jgi:hypothetical protein
MSSSHDYSPSPIVEGCFTKQGVGKWLCFACGKIISMTSMSRKCAHITGTRGHGVTKCTDPDGNITAAIMAAAMALEKTAACDKMPVREKEERRVAASDWQPLTKKQKTLDGAFNKVQFDKAHNM